MTTSSNSHGEYIACLRDMIEEGTLTTIGQGWVNCHDAITERIRSAPEINDETISDIAGHNISYSRLTSLDMNARDRGDMVIRVVNENVVRLSLPTESYGAVEFLASKESIPRLNRNRLLKISDADWSELTALVEALVILEFSFDVLISKKTFRLVSWDISELRVAGLSAW